MRLTLLLSWITVLSMHAVAAAQAPKDCWLYKQSTGSISINGAVVGTGYSGHGTGLNNPEKEKEPNVGPIPVGEWTISEAFKHNSKGPLVMRLTPVGHIAHGRTEFLIHGDN